MQPVPALGLDRMPLGIDGAARRALHRLEGPQALTSLPPRQALTMLERAAIADLDEPSAKVLPAPVALEMLEQRQKRILNHVLRRVSRQAAGAHVSSEAGCKRIEELQDFALHFVCRGRMTRERREQRQ